MLQCRSRLACICILGSVGVRDAVSSLVCIPSVLEAPCPGKACRCCIQTGAAIDKCTAVGMSVAIQATIAVHTKSASDALKREL